MIVDIRKERRPHQPLSIRELEVERVSSFKYLGVHLSEDLTWTLNTTQLVKKAQQRLYFLRRLRKFGMSPRILCNFYSCVVESTITSCITAWYSNTTVADRTRLQRVVKTAERITRTPLPSLQSIYNRRVHRRAASMLRDPTHPQHGQFTLLPSGRRYRSLNNKTQKLFLPLCNQTPEQLTGVTSMYHLVTLHLYFCLQLRSCTTVLHIPWYTLHIAHQTLLKLL
ncbi:uncharacterized protein LOC127355811 [Dicentrarchus labrax]|uniref:uncharacterized protein LOC127355811 n=1 Tax=Dicentrarchus labrax TaxID=13489 RepID=UPI0021F61924|nr:uncharacterized protein LOC127355811 [Dicentrarchus labrax]